MRSIRRLLCGIGILLAIAVVLLTSSSVLQHLVASNTRAPYFFVLSFLIGIGATFTAMLAAFVIEFLITGWSGSSIESLWKARASMKVDVLAASAMLLPHKYIDYVLSFGLLYLIGTQLPSTKGISVAHWLPTWGLQAGCALLLASLVNYWVHRLQHAVPALWALHKFHHSADELIIVTTFRGSKLESAFESALTLLPIALLSVPVAAKPTSASPVYFLVVIYFLFTALTRLNSFLIHSKLDLGYGWVGRWLLVSPRMHRIHHSTAPAYYNRNFSFDLVLWDRLFGTYTRDEKAAQLSVGLIDNPFNTTGSLAGVLRDYFVTTYLEFWRAIRKGPRAWLPHTLRNDASIG